MENENVKSFKVKKILNISLIYLLVLLLLVLIAGFVRILPKDIEYTNVTSNSFTVSWSTRFPTKGVVSVVDGKNRLPIAFTSLSKVLGFDTRDIRFAELKATEESSEKIWESSSQSVSLGDIVTEKIVDEKGSYYTHHIEVRGINPESEYRVMVGDGLLFLNSGLFKEEPTLKTLEVAEGIKTPIPTYGLIKNANGQDLPIEELLAVTDGVVYFNYLEELSGERSNTYSSSLNEDGAWYMDISTAVDSEGELFFEKYSQEISNIYGVLLIDLGPLGKWEKRINMNEASPAQTIVLNIPGYVENPDDPNMLIRVDGSSGIQEEVVKGVSAASCSFAGYCGPCFDGNINNSCACPESTLKARNCNGETEESIQEVIKKFGQCSGGAKEGDYVFYGGVCKQCMEGGLWETLKNTECRITSGQIFSDNSTEEEKVSDCTNAAEGAACTAGGKDGTCQQPYTGSTFRVCIPSGGKDGDIDEMIITNENRSCVDADGCLCKYYYPDGSTLDLNVEKGQECNIDAATTLKQTVKTEESCVNREQNIINGVYDSKGNCVSRDSTNQLKTDEVEGMYCANKTGKLYVETEDRLLECKGNEMKVANFKSPCSEGDKCSGRNDQCMNIKGELLDCNSYTWQKEEGADKRGAIASEWIEKGEKCEKGTCICNKSELLNKGEFCMEATSCFTGGRGGKSPKNEGKVCDTEGNTCQKGECTGSVSSSRPSLINKTYAQENLQSEYIIDTTTGKVLGIEPGIYTLKDGEETYVFTIKTQDVKEGRGDMIVYIDSNENGIQDDGERTLSDFSSSVKINAVKKLYTYDLKEGFNFISLPFLVNDEIARTAAGLLKILNAEYHDSVYSIAKYDGTWKVVGQNVQQYDNNDFQLIPGEGYIIKANKNISIQIAGRPVDFESTQDNAPITFYTGWNLIGVYGSNAQPYTAKSLIQSINQYETVDFTVDNVSRWESDMQRYDGFQLTNENGVDIEYGFDFPINTLQSYFVRVLQGRGNWQPDIR